VKKLFEKVFMISTIKKLIGICCSKKAPPEPLEIGLSIIGALESYIIKFPWHHLLPNVEN
jgi:hypothetical protein